MDGQTWQDRYKQAVLSYFARNGSPKSKPGEKTFPWDNGVSRDAGFIREHLVFAPACGIDVAKSGVAEETSWTEWGGTFGDDTTIYGLSVKVTCRCGLVEDQPFMLGTPSMAELINGISTVELL